MEIRTTDFEGLIVLKPKVFEDHRGYFYESYNKKVFLRNGILYDFVQDNQAFSKYGSVRGLHFQSEPHAQTKLVRAILGSILDVAVDIRPNSATFGKVFSIELTSENHLQLLIPKGFAHGYSVLSETAVVQYKCDAYYAQSHENGIKWDDENLNIDWRIPHEKAIISEKDQNHPSLNEYKSTLISL